MSDYLRQVSSGGVGVGSAEEGEEAEGLTAGDEGGVLGSGIGGGFVKEGVNEHRDALGGEGGDDALEVVDGDLVRIAVGELGEGGEDAGLELDHGEVGGNG